MTDETINETTPLSLEDTGETINETTSLSLEDTDETINETTSLSLEDTGVPVHLVTGAAGTAHVTSEDAAALNRAMFGPGLFVLGPDAMGLRTSTVTSPVVHADKLRAMWDGRFFSADNVDVPLDAPAAGQGRIDAITITYRHDDTTGIEKMSLEVIKGTPTTGTPVAPTVPNTGSAYLPSLAPAIARRVMWYVTLQGSPSSAFLITADYDFLLTQPADGPLTRPYIRYRPTVESTDELPAGRYIDDEHHLWQVTESERGTNTPSRASINLGTPGANWTGYITAAWDISGRVFADIAITRRLRMDKPSLGYTEKVGIVPAGYRPRYTCYFPAYSTGITSGVDHSTIWVQVDPDGSISLRFENPSVYLNINGRVEAHVSWAIA